MKFFKSYKQVPAIDTRVKSYCVHEYAQTHAIFKVFWSSGNRSFVFNQIFVYGTLMGVDYKSEKKI